MQTSIKINSVGQVGCEQFSFTFADSSKAKSGLSATITNLQEDYTVTVDDSKVARFEAEMCNAPDGADLDAICRKYFDEQLEYDGIDWANEDMS